MAPVPAEMSARFPAGLATRLATNADLERMVEFDNRLASDADWQSPAAAGQVAARL